MGVRLDQKGVTLVELMTVLGILVIIAAIGAGSFMHKLPRYRNNAAARDVVSDMRSARQQAATENWQYAFKPTSSSSYQIIRGDQPMLQDSDEHIIVVSRDNYEIPGRSEINWEVPERVPVFQPDGMITSWNLADSTFSSIAPDSITIKNTHNDQKTVTLTRFGRIKIQ